MDKRSLRNGLLLACLSLMGTPAWATVNGSLRNPSPGGRVEAHLFVEQGVLYCEATKDGKQWLMPSRLGLVVDGVDLGQHVSVMGIEDAKVVDETYPLNGNHAQARNFYSEAVVPLRASGKDYLLYLRTYDDGIAIRYALPEGTERVDKELTSWALPDDVEEVAWTEFTFDYEGYSHVTPLDSVPEGKTLAPPLTVKTPSGYLAFTEADNEAFPDMTFMREGRAFKAYFPASADGWNLIRVADESSKILDGRYKGYLVSPWRSVTIAQDLTQLVNSDLVTNLCPAPKEGTDFSWVKPGRCMWHWWSVGAPKYEDQKAWFDAAKQMGWEYYLIDEGWSWWKQEGRSPWDMLAEVIAYGKSQGVKSIVWVNSAEMRHAPERRAYLERVKAIGAAGIKIDFIPRATTEVMQWYMGAMQDCAELGLLLNLHGSVKPTGLSRTYPNDITREAVRGNEYQIRRYGRVLPQDHYVSLPFTRLLAGPADLTPVTLNPEEIAVGGYSWAHEMSQAIVFLSPMLHFSDHYSYYLESPMRDLLSEVPTTWDETLVLPCTEMGKVVAYARRKGNDWWIGVMNGDQPREISISLDFLKGKGKAALVYDDDTRLDGVKREDRNVSPQETLRMKLRPGGGFVARISK